MKITLNVLLIGLFTLIVSCLRSNENAKESIASGGQSNKELNLINQLKQQKNKEDHSEIDSIRLDKILKNALVIATRNSGKEKFYKKYDVMTDSIPVNVEINLDYHFVSLRPHLIIRRNDPNAIYIDIYSRYHNKFEKLISHEQWVMTYVSDTIRDINGDGLKDFVVNWYGSSGCCLKAFSNVYIFRPDQQSYSKNLQFINPTFSPKEKIVRGVCYGHPGKTEMYKYKWNGEIVDTVEYVSYEINSKGAKTGRVVISTNKSYDDKKKVIKIVNAVPKEYRKIEGYDWFTGEGY